MLESVLDNIEQLGEVRRKALLTHFGSVAALRKATAEEISHIPGIGEKIATMILEALQGSESLVFDAQTGEILEGS